MPNVLILKKSFKSIGILFDLIDQSIKMLCYSTKNTIKIRPTANKTIPSQSQSPSFKNSENTPRQFVQLFILPLDYVEPLMFL